jgi:hypothetical protein
LLALEGVQQIVRQRRVEIFRSRKGTNRAKGLPALAMTISSPAAACSTSRERLVFAS